LLQTSNCVNLNVNATSLAIYADKDIVPSHSTKLQSTGLTSWLKGTKQGLAVECDGDEWHGIDKYEEDMARQRILERCGVNFGVFEGTNTIETKQNP